MSLISSKTLLPGTGITLGDPGSAYTALQSHAFGAAGSFVLPAGDWFIPGNASYYVEYSTDGGTTWVAYNAASTPAFIRADGANIRVTATVAVTLDYFGPA